MIMLVRPEPISDESISGYFYRLFRLNGFHSAAPALPFLNATNTETQNNKFTFESRVLLAKLINKDEQIFNVQNRQLQILLNINKYYNSLFLLNRVKFCPICIKESYYHREIWITLLICSCPYHGVELQEECQKCKSKITMKSFTNCHCENCFFPYVDTQPLSQNGALFNEYQLKLSNILQWKGEYKALNLNINFVDYVELMLRSFHVISGGEDHLGVSNDFISAFYNRSNTKKDSKVMALNFANAMWMYDNFPMNYYTVLDDFLVRNTKKELYEKIKSYERIFNNVGFERIKTAYQEFFLDKLNKGVVRKDFSVFKKDPELLLNRKYLRREEVKNSTRMTYQKISNLSNNEKLLLSQNPYGERKGYFVESSSLQSCLANESLMITKREAAFQIGVHPSTINKLIDASLLDVCSAFSETKIINRTQVDELVKNCLGEKLTFQPENVLSFHEVLIKHSVNFLTVIHLLQFTLDGVLHPIRITDDSKLADNYYFEKEIDSCVIKIKEKYSSEKGITFKEVMKIFHVGEKRLWSVLTNNNVEPDFTLTMKEGRKRYYFKEQTTKFISELLHRDA